MKLFLFYCVFLYFVASYEAKLKLITKKYELINIKFVSETKNHRNSFMKMKLSSNNGYVYPIISIKKNIGLLIKLRAFNQTITLRTIFSNNFPNVIDKSATINVIGKNSLKTDLLSNRMETDAGYFVGRVEGRFDCDVNGYVPSGNFSRIRATITCPEDDMYLEPAEKHIDYENNNNILFTSIIYRKNDVIDDVCPFSKGNKTESCLFRNAKGLNAVSDNQDEDPSELNTPSIIRLRRQDYRGRVCGMHIIADHTYHRFFGGSEAIVVSEMVTQFQESDKIYRATDFNGDGNEDGIGLKIKKISIFRDDNQQYFLSQEGIKSDIVLDLLSSWAVDQGDFCLTVVFTNRDYKPEQTIGLAWVGTPNQGFGNGGLCDTVRDYRSRRKRMNTGMVTNVNGRNILPTAVSTITFAHEVGHSFGAVHDEENCASSDPNQNYIMFPSANVPKTPQNKMFSPCSIALMFPVVRNKGFCLEPDEGPRCGDGIVQAQYEECDCGMTPEECHYRDPCCVPAQSLSQQPCTLARDRGAKCSPVTTPCCEPNCFISPQGRPCSTAQFPCTMNSVCEGASPHCSPGFPLPDGTPCAGTSLICVNGLCDQTICSFVGLLDCECTEPRSQICVVCCVSQDGRCVPADALGYVPPEGHLFLRMVGSPCDLGRGTCTADGVCGVKMGIVYIAEPEGDGKGESWIINNWYYIVVVIVLLVVVIACGFGSFLLIKKRKRARVLKGDINSAKAKVAAHSRGKRLPKDIQMKAARLANFFPTVSLDEIISMAENGRSEEHNIKELTAKGHPFKTAVNAKKEGKPADKTRDVQRKSSPKPKKRKTSDRPHTRK